VNLESSVPPLMDLQQFRKLARNWDAFGDADPLFGVLSDPTKYGGQWRVDDFFASGEAHVKKWLGIVTERGATFHAGTCLDFGCGVGRLTRPLSDRFQETVGIDVAKSMIAVARRYNTNPNCRFVVSRDPDLRSIDSDTFDFVHSCLVLQHIPPEVTVNYIEEFFRVAKPEGVVVFQVPAEQYSEEIITERYRLPDAAYSARLSLIDPPTILQPGGRVTLRLTVTNESPNPLAHDIPAGRHICIANHWLRADGSVEIADDGRAKLPKTLAPGGRCEVELAVHAPAEPGDHILEIDLVQERVCWFAEKGSRTARLPVVTAGPAIVTDASPVATEPLDNPPRASLLHRLLRPLRRGTPTFEMHVVPRADVEAAIVRSGGTLLHAIDDGAAGYRWLSYTYLARKSV
jgi:SAM-dependent methyltransferase